MNLAQGFQDAAQTIAEIRRHGGLVLRIHDGWEWRLQVYNGVSVPTPLKFRLLELEPFVMVLLRKLASEDALSADAQKR